MYKCQICGYIHNEELKDDFICPLCGVDKNLFEKIKTKELQRAIYIDNDNISITRDIEKCVDCGLCTIVCNEREGLKNNNKKSDCLNCGQCIHSCPVNAIKPKSDKDLFLKALKQGKTCIAYTSPSVRVALGDSFGLEAGTFVQGKMIQSLRKLGFEYVLDVTFGADLTIMEEASELVERITNNQKLPMFTSCCPSWIKYAETFYPELLTNISSCKSPIGMQGMIVKKYFAKKLNLENIFTVAITPCTAKKYEINRTEISGTDLVLTTQELVDLIKEKSIDFNTLEDSQYDSLLGEGSGAGMIFGNTGGVTEAALRTAYYLMTSENLTEEKLEFTEVRGMENIKEATININGNKINVAIINQMSSAIPILESVKNNTCKYHFIEIMNCLGGCIGGGGQPRYNKNEEINIKEKRIKSLYNKDASDKIRLSHENEEIKTLYKELLDKPLSLKSKELLHTKYEEKTPN